MSESGPPPPSRITIKFGKPPANAAATNKASRAAPPSSLGKRSRTHHGFEAANDSDDDEKTNGKHESISTFGEDASTLQSRKTGKPLVIQGQKNVDWKSAAKAQRTGQTSAPESAAKGRTDGNAVQADESEKPQAFGLIIKKNPLADSSSEKTDVKATDNDVGQLPPDPEKEAIDALMGKSDSTRGRVIPRADPRDDVNSFKRDMQKAAMNDEPEFDDMPVEEFGAAMLRGMGWNGEKTKGQRNEVKRRDNLLGLGAKHLKGQEELGAWNQKRPKLRDHRHEEEKRKASRDSRDSRRHESYKEERDRERHERDRSGGHRRERQYNHR